MYTTLKAAIPARVVVQSSYEHQNERFRCSCQQKGIVKSLEAMMSNDYVTLAELKTYNAIAPEAHHDISEGYTIEEWMQRLGKDGVNAWLTKVIEARE
jgi:hypothetical protein